MDAVVAGRYRVFIALTIFLVAAPSWAIDIKLIGESPIGTPREPAGQACELFVSGDIDTNSPGQLQGFVEGHACTALIVGLASRGGDVQAAMDMGRYLRRIAAITEVGPRPDGPHLDKGTAMGWCASACVFVYAGGVERRTRSYLGLHRPYSLDVVDTYQQALAQERLLKLVVQDYLREMNIPADLFDRMNAIPADQVEWINPSEADRLIGREDPGYADFVAGTKARSIGIDKEEYYRRLNVAARVCGKRSGDDAAVCNACIVETGVLQGCRVRVEASTGDEIRSLRDQ